jgi:N-acetylmuramoyl-L-alanine amidase
MARLISRLLLALAMLAWPGLAVAQQGQVVARSVDLQTAGELTRLVFELSGPVSPKGHVLAQPDRVVVDLPEITFKIDPATGRGPAAPKPDPRRRQMQAAQPLLGAVASYRFGLVAPGKSRIVIDLTHPARIARLVSEPLPGGQGARLVIELGRTDQASFLAEVTKSAEARPASATMPLSAGQASGGLPIVVLDAGHGGIDTGAHALNGALEKDIVFDFSKALAARLERGGQVRVVLTRESDVFVALGERVRRARAVGAALFISIHADTLSYDGSVSGATVYTVSDRASDAEAARVAEKENQADIVAGLDGAEDQSDVSDILFDLTRRETRAYSHVFARTLVGYWQEIGALNKNPHRSAGFRVLKAPDVPSVLLELGYLSSKSDLASLTSPQWRDKASELVAKAVEGFFKDRAGVGAKSP